MYSKRYRERQLTDKELHTKKHTGKWRNWGKPVSDEMGKGVTLHVLLPQNVARLSEGHYGFVRLVDCHNLHQPC